MQTAGRTTATGGNGSDEEKKKLSVSETKRGGRSEEAGPQIGEGMKDKRVMTWRVEREELVQELVQIIPSVDLFLDYHLHHRFAKILVGLGRIDGHWHTFSDHPAIACLLLSTAFSLPGMVVPPFVENKGGLEDEGIGGAGRGFPGVGGRSGGGGGGGESGGGGRRGGGGRFGFGVREEEGGEDAGPAAITAYVDYSRLAEREAFAVSLV